MPGHDDQHLSEEQAAQLWQRAAALQAEAAQAAESAAAAEGAKAVVRHEGYQVDHVRQAAIEAGIGAEFLDAALVDMRAEAAVRPKKKTGRLVEILLGETQDALVARRVIAATPEEVLEAMEDVLPKEPYRLQLKDRQGDPLNGGLLHFDIGSASMVAVEGFAMAAAYGGFKEVFASLRPMNDGASCELTVRGPIAGSHKVNAATSSVFTGILSGLGGAVGWVGGGAAAAALMGAGVATGSAAVAGTAITAAAFFGSGKLSLSGYHWLYRWSQGKGTEGLDGMLAVIAVQAQGGWGLGADSGSDGSEPDAGGWALPAPETEG
ncbi:MAG: hypothetical protein AAF389_11435 [Gemmatimonadota bacterium]